MAFQSSSEHSEAKKIPQKSRCPHHFACLFARLFVFVFQKKFFQPNPIGIAPKSFLDMKCFFLKMTKKLRKIFFCNGQKKMCEIFLSVFQKKKIFFSKNFFWVKNPFWTFPMLFSPIPGRSRFCREVGAFLILRYVRLQAMYIIHMQCNVVVYIS